MYYKCTALDVLEKREWIGSYIPYCFVEGNKSIVDGKTYYTGLYEDMVSTQVLYNYATNTAIELAESAPISPFIGDARAFKGYEKYYDTANTKNYSYLPYNAIDENDVFMTYGQGLCSSDLLGAIWGVIAGGFNYIYLQFIDQGVIQKQLDLARERLEEQGLTESQIEDAEKITKMMMGPGVQVVIVVLVTILFMCIFGLIVSGVLKREKSVFDE
jgi:hypothetical protein